MSQESTVTEFPRDSVIEAVRQDLLRRQQFGFPKYGVTLENNPATLLGKLQHIYEETLDAANYLKWTIMQLSGDPALHPIPGQNTGNKEEFDNVNREWLARQIQTFAENHNPALLENVSTGALQDELQRRIEAANPLIAVPEGGITNSCPHGVPWDDCPDCRH